MQYTPLIVFKVALLVIICMYLYYECQLSTCNYFTSGMHKKSLEASKKIREEEGCTDRTENKDFRSESIAQLRAKAQEHNAKLLQTLNKSEQQEGRQPIDDSSNSSFDGSFFSVESTELIRP